MDLFRREEELEVADAGRLEAFRRVIQRLARDHAPAIDAADEADED